MLIRKQISLLTTSFLLFFFSGFSHDLTAAPGQALGLSDLKFTSSSGFNALVLATPAPFPARVEETASPVVSAKAALVMDRASHAVLFVKNARTPLPPASTTKIMTALIALETLPLERVVTVPDVGADRVANGSIMGLTSGEQISVEGLIWGLLLNSGNDAASVLANANGSVSNFVQRMNQKAQLLNLKNTHFENPSGLDRPDHFSSAYDLTLLADAALNNPFFAQVVGTTQKVVAGHSLRSTNPLLGQVKGVKGVKTGWTQAAGECLVVLVEREGHEVLITILGSKDREADAQSLIEWTFQAFDWGLGQTYSSATHSVGSAGT